MSEISDVGRILDELTVMRAENRETLVAVTQIQEQVRDVHDHEARLRVIEQLLPKDAQVRLTALERWRYGLPIAGLTAVVSAGLSAWTATRGA
jgi:hypothetical protein